MKAWAVDGWNMILKGKFSSGTEYLDNLFKPLGNYDIQNKVYFCDFRTNWTTIFWFKAK